MRELATEAGRKEDIAIFVAFALRNTDLAGLQSDIGQTEADVFVALWEQGLVAYDALHGLVEKKMRHHGNAPPQIGVKWGHCTGF